MELSFPPVAFTDAYSMMTPADAVQAMMTLQFSGESWSRVNKPSHPGYSEVGCALERASTKLLDALALNALRAFAHAPPSPSLYAIPCEFWRLEVSEDAIVGALPVADGLIPKALHGQPVVMRTDEFELWAGTGSTSCQPQPVARKAPAKRGRPEEVGSYRAEDTPAAMEAQEMYKSGQVRSLTKGFEAVADKVPGNTLEAKVRRLRKRHGRIFGSK